MRVKNWMRIGFVAAVFAFSALADHGGDGNRNNNGGNNNQNNNNNGMFSSSIVGSMPNTMIGGVASGGAPWIVSEGQASISPNGSVHVEVRGLLLTTGAPPNLVGTVGPVQMVAASVVCNGSGGMVVASTVAVNLSAGGNAQIEDTVNLPASCMAPAVLVRIFNPAGAPGSQLGPFIAATGFAAGAGNGQNGNGDDHGDDH